MGGGLDAGAAVPGITLDESGEQFEEAVVGGIEMTGESCETVVEVLLVAGNDEG